MAYDKGPYDYYHLLSGEDLPIKTQDHIHSFFDKNRGKEFIGFTPEDVYVHWNNFRLIHLFPKSSRRLSKFKSVLRSKFLDFQIKLKFTLPSSHKLQLRKGSCWCSLTNDFLELLFKYENFFLRKFRYSVCFDEAIVHTVAWNSHFRNLVYDIKSERNGNLRFIDWERGNPYYLTLDDLPQLIQSNCLYCRKVQDMRLALKLKKLYKNH